MTQFDQSGQKIFGIQHNAGRDIINNYPQATWIPPVMLPPRAQPFVGREEDLAWILQQLIDDAGKTITLCGPGGMGKTALAAEALGRLISRPDWLTRFPGGIFYHSFYTSPSLAVAFEDLARIFQEDPGADSRRAALRALSRRRTILVFDGVEVLEDPLSLWEFGGQHIVLLLSRRQSDALDLAHRRDIRVLPHEQAITLLTELAGSRAGDRECVERLVAYIDGYPLALQLIGRYLSSQQEEVGDYLRWFEEEGLVAMHQGKRQRQSVPLLLQRSYDTLTANEQAVFLALGLLAPAPFPMELIQGILELPARGMRQALGSLINLSILRRSNVVDEDYEVSHPLVHTFARERLLSQVSATSFPSVDTITIWRERLLRIVTLHFEQSDPYDRIALALWLPHIFPLVSADNLMDEQSLRSARLFNTVGLTAFTQGKYVEAELLYQRALAIREQQSGSSHPETAASLNSLALLYKVQGKYAKAEPLYQRALAIYEQQLGSTHPEMAASLNNLAGLYKAQGKYVEAEALYQRALAIWARLVGPSHPNVASNLNNLAILYYAQGKYAEAELLYQQALAIREQQLGPSHPETATSLNSLALLYKVQGKYAKAESLYQRALAIHEQQLGSSHPGTATYLNNLAGLYDAQGKYIEAERLYLRALEIREQHLGPTHPYTAQSQNNLALLYYDQGKYAKAEPLLQQALEIREQYLGPSHPDTAASLNNLALLYQKQGNVKAEPLLQRALAIQEQQLGPEHPDLAVSLNNLALLYRVQGRYTEAEPLYVRSLAIRKQQVGLEHFDTASSQNNLATLYQAQGKYAEAELLYQQALTITEQQRGSNHPETATILNNLAVVYDSQSKYAEAEHLYVRALAIRAYQLGPIHPDTASSFNCLAQLYQEQGKYAEVDQLLQRFLAICERLLGPEHPSIPIARKHYTSLFRAMDHDGVDKQREDGDSESFSGSK